MAVLAPERAEEEDPTPSRPLPAVRRWPPPRPLRDVTPPLPDDRRLAWILAAVLGLATLISRLWNITYPRDLLFDEAYYPPEAHELLTWGFEYNRGYSFIVHPPLGKWFIALGEQVFGYNSLGWRFPSAVAGAITVVVLFRLTRRLTGSTLMGLIAGLLIALDGFAFTSSRIGLLDVFLQTLVVSAVACLVVDRDKVRERIRDGADRLTDSGFRLGPRGWRIAAGVLFGAACAVKWSGVWFLAFFAVLSLFWDRAAWREAGVPRPTRVVAPPRPARRAVGTGGRPGADVPGVVHRLVPRRDVAGQGLGAAAPRHGVPVDPRRAARALARARPVAGRSTTGCRRRTRGSPARGRGW